MFPYDQTIETISGTEGGHLPNHASSVSGHLPELNPRNKVLNENFNSNLVFPQSSTDLTFGQRKVSNKLTEGTLRDTNEGEFPHLTGTDDSTLDIHYDSIDNYIAARSTTDRIISSSGETQFNALSQFAPSLRLAPSLPLIANQFLDPYDPLRLEYFPTYDSESPGFPPYLTMVTPSFDALDLRMQQVEDNPLDFFYQPVRLLFILL